MRYITLLLLWIFTSCETDQPDRILVFSKTSGYRHESIRDGKQALLSLGQEHGVVVDTTEDASVFNDELLPGYKAVVFLSTTNDVLDSAQQESFRRYINGGGGFVGIHAAADTEYDWPWFGQLVGARFDNHPEIQDATLRRVRDFGGNPTPDEWTRRDEWYNYKEITNHINVIYILDEATYQGGQHGEDHPIAWYHEFEGGRAFYTGLGHTSESYSDSLFLKHVWEGIRYAMTGIGEPGE